MVVCCYGRVLTAVTSVARVTSVAMHGKLIASGSHDQTIRIWDATRFEHKLTLTGHKGRCVLSLDVLSPCGDSSCTYFIACVTVFHVLTCVPSLSTHLCMSQLHALTCVRHSVWSVAFSSDGELIVSGSADRTIKIWDASTGQLQSTGTGHSLR